MKKILLSTSALALLLSTNITYASELFEAEEFKGSSASADEFDPRDRNRDGKVSIGERIHHFFDRDEDGDIDGHDFVALVKAIFDRDGDGDIDGEDAKIFLGEIKSILGKTADIAGYLQGTLKEFKTHEFFALLPEKLSGPLGDLFDTVTDVSGKLANGANIGVAHVGTVEGQLDAINSHIRNIRDAKFGAEDLFTAKSEITKLLKIAESMVDTPNSVKTIHKIYKKLAAIEAV